MEKEGLEGTGSTYTIRKSGDVEITEDLPEGDSVKLLARGVGELQEIQERLQARVDRGQEDTWSRIHWVTASRNCYKFLKQGARWHRIRQEVIKIRWLEQQKKTEVIAIWDTANQEEVDMADSWSKATNSTDEWGLQEGELNRLWAEWGIQPTVDAFASSENKVCEKFFSKWPQTGSAGVNFFAQQLQPEETYYCCPPVKEAGHMLRRLQRFNQVTAVVVVPAWEGSVHWSLLKEGSGYIREVQEYKKWKPSCVDTSNQSSIFSLNNVNMWAGIYRKGCGFRFSINIDLCEIKYM